MNEIKDEIKEDYCIKDDDFNIPQEMKINISKFYQDVSIKSI